MLQTGDAPFNELTELTGRRFDATPRHFHRTNFIGIHIDQATDGKQVGDRIDNLQLISVPCTSTEYRSMRSQLARTKNCRHDVACALAQSAQVTEVAFDPTEESKGLNRITTHMKQHNLRINFLSLERKSLHIQKYFDTSRASNRDLSSQLCIAIALCEIYTNGIQLLRAGI